MNGWLRLGHRWIGIVVALFVLLLAVTGIALNHGRDWNLDQRYVSWNWLLDAYGIRAPAPSASFAVGDRRATLIGQRLYLNEREIARGANTLTGMIMLGSFVLVTSRDSALLLTSDGELVEQIDLSNRLPGPVQRLGRAGERTAVSSAGAIYIGDANVTAFEASPDSADSEIAWSLPSPPGAILLSSLQAQYRGRGLSVERLLADLHSGRIISVTGPYLMDAVAVLLIVLSSTGLLLWMRPGRRGNGQGR
jgi:hypothetical protein